MFKNYLVTAFRNLLRFKLDSFLNISGLVIGLSAAMLIVLFVRHETSYDGFWKDADRLHRIQTRWVLEGRDDIRIVQTTGPLKAALASYFPNELETVARLHIRQYPFRINNGWIILFCILAGVLATVVVTMTVGSQAWGIARVNPIHAIRQE